MAGSGSKKKAHQENESNQARRRRRREPGQDRDGVRKHILTLFIYKITHDFQIIIEKHYFVVLKYII